MVNPWILGLKLWGFGINFHPPPPPIFIIECKIWGFHGGDYEECRLLGYKTPVRTSQETQ
jgi:hypothetical protein